MTDLPTLLAELEEAERAAKLTGDQWTVGYENIGPADNTRLVAFLYDGDSEDGPIICIDEEPNGEDLPSPALHFIALMRTHLPALIEAALRPPMPKDFQIPALPGMFEVKLLQELRPAIDVMREAAALLRSEAGE